MPVKISANRGDVAEGIMGAALTAKFVKRKDNQTLNKLPAVTKRDINTVLNKVFSKGGYTRKVADINQTQTLTIFDDVTFRLTLPKPAMDFLSVASERNKVDDIYRRAITYANTDTTFAKSADILAKNQISDDILVDADGVSNQLETKVDIGLFANNQRIANQISLKVAGGNQFAQVVGFGLDKFNKLFEELMQLSIDSNIKEQTENFIQEFNVKDAFSFKTETRKDVTGSSWASLLKKAAGVYYKGAAAQMRTNIDDPTFKRNLANAIRYGATRGDEDVQLVKLSGAGYVERTFGPEFDEELLAADLSISTSFKNNPTITIKTGRKPLLKIRARIDASKSKAGYSLMLRQLFEAGTGLFSL
tara:strand:- start:1486 stop:2571 length:1086 start_codon:yes stop_codon:yes gene_type:complete